MIRESWLKVLLAALLGSASGAQTDEEKNLIYGIIHHLEEESQKEEC